MDLHIDDFYQHIALGLLALFQSFPRKVDLYVEDLIGPQPLDEFGLPHARQQSALSALLWLGEEGYVRFTGVLGHNALEQCVLSEKGFIALTRSHLKNPALPASIARVQATLAFKLRQAISERDSEKLIEHIQTLFQAGDTA